MNNFTKVKSDNKGSPMFVPPFVLENMARAGIEEAKSTILQSQYLRKKRTQKLEEEGSPAKLLKAVIPTGRAYVQVYDSKNKWKQQFELIRRQGDSPTGDEAVDNSYDCICNINNYLKSTLNRNSLDNNGMDLICNVHYGEKYNNAFWDGDDITLGDGDGVIFTSFAKSLDVIAHELGHAVIQYNANFEYHDQPGALHEHFADVFGSVITQCTEKQTADDADWLIGDEIMGPELYGEALRSMSEPGTAYDNEILGKDPQPDHMKNYYKGPDDLGGVHINSGIMNKAFYLTAMDIGTDQAASIWYNALQNLWSTANFNDAFEQIVKASRILVKNEDVRKDSTQRVRTAFREVGLPF